MARKPIYAVSVAVSREEMEALKAYAAEHGTTVSLLTRTALTQATGVVFGPHIPGAHTPTPPEIKARRFITKQSPEMRAALLRVLVSEEGAR